MTDGGGTWSWNRSYSLVLMTVSYIVGEVAHFLINTTGRAVAREIHFGDLACFPGNQSKTNDNCTAVEGQSECEERGCVWDYSGLGFEYQVLAGPSFVAIFSVSAVVLATTSDRLANRVSRTLILGGGTLVFSLALLGMGLSTSYWQLLLCRMMIAAGEAVCRPMCGSLLADLFPPESRGLANGIFSWGVYWGYGLAFLLGIQGTQLDLLGYGWRGPYVLAALPGILTAALVIFTLKEPSRQAVTVSLNNVDDRSCVSTLRLLYSPTLLLLLLAAMARHTAGLSWAYNTRPFFQNYHPEFNIGYWILGASIGGGSFGVFAGGFFSDRVVSRLGLASRLWLLSLATLISSPIAAGTLTIDPPGAMAALVCYYLFAETWFAILFTVIVEVVAPEVRATAIALFLFAMNQVGGNLPVVIDPLKIALGNDYRAALGLMWPGCLAISSVLFLVASLPLSRAQRNTREESGSPVEENPSAPLIITSPQQSQPELLASPSKTDDP